MEVLRKQRGILLAQTSRIIQKSSTKWIVPSQTNNGRYTVELTPQGATCTCPDYELHQTPCKHIYAAQHEDNTPAQYPKKPTYKQDWPAYNKAQSVEKQYFKQLLADLANNTEEPEQKRGRPKIPRKDMLYAMIFKVYSQLSARRFDSDIRQAHKQGHITTKPHYNSTLHYFQKQELTKELYKLLEISSKPLTAIETSFAIDSTGFGTSKYQRWFSHKHGKEIRTKKWLKAHIVVGVKTNIITAAKITDEFQGDSPQLPELLHKTKQNFEIQEFSADKAYLSKNNLKEINKVGATPYIPFKQNSTPSKKGMIWKRMYHYFELQKEEFLEHYHKRSNAETTMHMIKSKFGDSLKSKKEESQTNELVCKLIAHNICCVIQEIHERGIQPEFFLARTPLTSGKES